MIVAINQPYFSPYAGYYALIRKADIFVLFDCVQFQRRGRIHRSQTHKSQNFQDGWLTLPLQKMPQQTLIKDMIMHPWRNNFNHPLLQELSKDIELSPYKQKETQLIDILTKHHNAALNRLNIKTKILRSSELNIAQNIKGEERIIEICKVLGATKYINLPGGRSLYNEDHFLEQNIKLEFIVTDNISKYGYLQAMSEGTLSEFLQESQISCL